MTERAMPFSGGMVPVPNRLFDEILPKLSDTELRVLLIVLRQTWGFREGDDLGGWRYKRRDWISHRQLLQKTGRKSEAVSKAIQSLVAASLITVEKLDGTPLQTPEDRRRYLGKLYYGLGDKWKTTDAPHPAFTKRTTRRKYNKKQGEGRRGGWARAGDGKEGGK